MVSVKIFLVENAMVLNQLPKKRTCLIRQSKMSSFHPGGHGDFEEIVRGGSEVGGFLLADSPKCSSLCRD